MQFIVCIEGIKLTEIQWRMKVQDVYEKTRKFRKDVGPVTDSPRPRPTNRIVTLDAISPVEAMMRDNRS